MCVCVCVCVCVYLCVCLSVCEYRLATVEERIMDCLRKEISIVRQEAGGGMGGEGGDLGGQSLTQTR